MPDAACYGAPMRSRPRFVLSLAAPLALCACAKTTSSYPSLGIRDVERASGIFTAAEPKRIDVPPVEVDLPGGLNARIASLVVAARKAHEGFMRLVPEARRRVAAAGSGTVASDSWGSAQVALAELEAARSEAAIPLGDLEAIYVSQTVQAEQSAALVAAREQVLGWIAQEDAMLAELRRR